MLSVTQLRRILAWFFLLNYFLLVALTWDGMDFSAAVADGPVVLAFALAVWLSHGFIYLMPVSLLVFGLERLVHRKRDLAKPALLYSLVILATALTSLTIYANAKLFALYGIFINGFVINLLTTPGGLESMGASTASNLTLALVALAFLVGQAALLALTHYLYRRFGEPRWLPRRFFAGLLLVFAVTTFGERMVYAYTTATGKTEFAARTQRVPYYVGLSARGILGKLGVKVDRNKEYQLAKGHLNYPLHPLDIDAPSQPLNVVWLVSESWRADMLDAEIMPATWAFARGARRFTNNHSGGNGTRVGVFSMFTGIPGNYWFPMLAERKGALIIDVLKKQDYQMSFFTSAKFSYPEFDATIFSQVPSQQLHEIPGGAQGWEKDQQNVGKLLNFIDARDKSRPFFTFMFFESPHARYYFPPESVIRTPYPEDINYVTLSREQLAARIGPIKNRYVNSVHHLDSQFGRVFAYLKKNALLDSTIVVALGDHGEEFMEKGRWGHNSAFTDEQTRTPLILWVPGMQSGVYEGMSNHMDVIPTLMPILGVKNPSRDYSIGINLLTDEVREHAVLAEWSSTAYIDGDVKIAMPLAVASRNRLVTGPHDEVLTAQQQRDLFASKAGKLVAMMEELGRFVSKAK